MNSAVLLLAVATGLTVTLSIVAVARLTAAMPRRVRGRLAALVDQQGYQADVSVLRDEGGRSTAMLARFLTAGGGNVGTRLMLERAGLPLRVGEYVALRLLAAAGGATAGLLLGSSLGGGAGTVMFAVGGLAAGMLLPPVLLRRRIRRRSAAVEGQLVEFAEVMASMLRTGFGYAQALNAAAERIDPPLHQYLQDMIDKVSYGGDIDEALTEMNERIGSQDFDMIATAIAIQRRSGGNLAEILDGVAATIRDRQSFYREVKALTARERFSAIILALFPFLLVGALTALLPETYGALFNDGRGQVILGVAVLLDVLVTSPSIA